jgi:hypothetical protein
MKLVTKLSAMQESRAGVVNMHFRQIESLAALYYRLRPNVPFPPTRGWAASPDFLRNVADELFVRQPHVVLEGGSGVTTIVVARSLQMNGHGHLYSLEHDTTFAEQTRSKNSGAWLGQIRYGD